MSIADHSATHNTSFFDRLQAMADAPRQPNMLLPSSSFTLFALSAIVAGAALAFMT